MNILRLVYRLQLVVCFAGLIITFLAGMVKVFLRAWSLPILSNFLLAGCFLLACSALCAVLDKKRGG